MPHRMNIVALTSMILLLSLTSTAFAQSGRPGTNESISEPLGQEISETQRSIHALESELERQNKYLDDLYTVNEKRHRAKSDQVLQMEALQQQINDLTRMMGELTNSVQTLATKDTLSATPQMEGKKKELLFTHQDSLELLILKRREAESRRQIDALTTEILQLTEDLKDPKRRYALAQKMKEQGNKPGKTTTQNKTSATVDVETISARSIDLAAVEFVRKGQSLDQARMSVIDRLPDDRILIFYQELPNEDRYRLYDLSDEIMARDRTSLVAARRSALFFYFYTQ